ncbi:site-specific integrase [Vibrio parahaemolyticus]|nr:site-specific integrase [Vibrio parahaemolyticus]
MATVQARTGAKGTTYRVQFMRGGSRISKSFQFKKDAQRFAANITVNEDFAESLTNHTLNTLKFSDAIAQYIEQDSGKDLSKHQRLSFWLGIFKDTPVGKVTRQQVRAELKNLSQDRAPATLNRYKAALSSFYRYLTEEYEIEHNPTKGIRQFTEDNARTRFLSKEELPRLLNACKGSQWEQLYLLVLLAITTGARRTELLTLTWESINFKAKTAHLPKTKNGEQRILTLTADVLTELMKFRQIGGYVFPHKNHQDLYFRNFDCYWQEALNKAGITDFRFHDLRHTCASLLAMNGASLLEIAQVLGHKSITMTQRYSHLCIEHKASLTDRVFGGIVNE